MGTKLHEILAVENDLSSIANNTVEEVTNIFSGKPEFFLGRVRTLVMFDAERAENENMTEESEIVTTVEEQLAKVSDHLTRYWDVVFEKECANQEAKADVILNGEAVLTNVPATMLLSLETKLKALRPTLQSIPTLQSGQSWKLDPTREVVYEASPATTFRSEKNVEFRTVAEATEHHPAQVQPVSTEKNVGKYTTVNKSSMISPREKAKLLDRLNQLLRAVKQARMRANTQEVVMKEIGGVFFDFLLSD